MRTNLQVLADETLYIKRLADLGNSYTFWRKSADKVVKITKDLLVDRPMEVWFKAVIRGVEEEVSDYRVNMSEYGQIPFNHKKIHRNILWYLNNSIVFREKDYETILKLYRRIARLLKEGEARNLFKRRIKKIEKMLKKEMNRGTIRHG